MYIQEMHSRNSHISTLLQTGTYETIPITQAQTYVGGPGCVLEPTYPASGVDHSIGRFLNAM